ncbi:MULTISPECIES: hypothetical protein [Halolamina]|uniref:Uncharacterized protein n=1 Tax=Halolamina pelagica TaxID=699431 RepID=A0A1I5RJG4_9EURY|nr:MULTISPECIES: hypothetical protein [Halolamina]NHX35220.1 hypothetical protein [Halolamina sp. R1-12]SFP58672.1 hypothetical protein SAMN05216277_1059 [Halolamina pelagica]
MSLQNSAPTNVDPQSEDTSLLGRVAAKVRRHVERWGRRYVEMRVDARTR